MIKRITTTNKTIALLVFSMLMLSSAFAMAAENPAELLSQSFREAIHKVKPAVVSISSEKDAKPSQLPQDDSRMDEMQELFKRFFGEGNLPNPRNFDPRMNPRRDWQGSGVIISPEGDVLTNNHVVDGADSITVTLDDGRTIDADMSSVLSDPGSDLAVFKLKDKDEYPYAELGDSDALLVGDWVLAIGSPFGLDQTVTQGIVSAKGRTSSDVHIGGDAFFVKNYIQTTAAINPGNSGGPLINLEGEIIGLNNAIQTAGVPGNLGIGFAIPSNLINSVIKSLNEFGEVKRGYVGVKLDSLENNNLNKWYKQEYGIDKGALVSEVLPDSPAEKADLKEGDLIIELNGKTVINPGQMINMVTAFPPGEEIELTIMRKGKQINKTIVLSQRPTEIALSVSQKYLGIAVETLTPELAKKLGYEEGFEGVLVTNVDQGSSAFNVNIRRYDVITEVKNGEKVTTAAEFEKLLTEFVEKMRENGDSDRVYLVHINRADPSYPNRWVAPKITLKKETDKPE